VIDDKHQSVSLGDFIFAGNTKKIKQETDLKHAARREYEQFELAGVIHHIKKKQEARLSYRTMPISAYRNHQGTAKIDNRSSHAIIFQ